VCIKSNAFLVMINLDLGMYHPDFQHGCPAYFDLSVRSTTQASHISSSSSNAGVAAATGELVKD